METKMEFYNLFEELLSAKREDNSSFLSNEKYLNIINELKDSNKYHRLNKFEIINIREEEKLIAPFEKGSSNLLYYVKIDE
ncbi:KRAB-A domain-containing protein 2-like [Aphis craccivora]|uniref:KRAB-A domain-containing protein 2-like n=1 Tax=Aphis craccivora TaxID=307492 RepID=A0A6G0ZFF4_APHCR|nr:KRAB-A domain-containing protein 2-like [Aphis craccivora]